MKLLNTLIVNISEQLNSGEANEMARGRYTDEELRNIASQYQTKTEWRKKHSGSYAVVMKRKSKEFLDDITSHMVRPKLERAYTDEQLKNIAKKYQTKSEWRKNEEGSYVSAHRRGKEFFSKITSHMETLGNKWRRLIYVFEFPDNHAYVGLTYNSTKRKKQHLDSIRQESRDNQSAVYLHMKNTGLTPIFKTATDLMTVDEAKIAEEKFIQQYEKNGWIMLNRMVSGGLGGNAQIYTDEYLRDDAKKYNSKSEWKKNNRYAYSASLKREKDFYNDITSHMVRPPSSKLKYTDEILRDIAKKYNTKKDWLENDGSSLTIARERGADFFKDITSHMEILNRYEPYTEDELRDIAKKYNKKSEWAKREGGAKSASYRKGIDFVNDITSHMISGNLKYTDDILRDIASQYKTKNEWKKSDPNSYQRALKNKELYLDITSHMN
jgi:hypothetical protein